MKGVIMIYSRLNSKSKAKRLPFNVFGSSQAEGWKMNAH